MRKLLTFIMVLSLALPAYGAVQAKEDGVNKGYVQGFDFKNGPVVVRTGIEAEVDYVGAFDSEYLRLDATNGPLTGGLDLAAGTATAGTAPLKFTDGVALTTPEVGAVEFHDNRLWVTNVEARRAIDRSSSTLTTTQTVADSTTETTIMSESIGGGGFKVGNFMKLIASGIISSASAADVCTIRIKIGANTIATITSPGKTLSDACFHIDGHSTIRAIGASGSVFYHVDMVVEDNSNEVCSNATLDTTTATAIVITAQWNNAKAGNSISLTQGILEFKN